MSKEEEQQSFRVTDKRGFSQDGEIRTHEVAGQESEQPKTASPGREEKNEAPPAPIDFSTYIASYGYQAQVLLGLVPNPATNKKEEDLESARYIIDLLSMLQEKTKGNLSKEEGALLERILYDLRMIFMAKTNRIKI
jgi:hypothetical protein